MKALVVYESMFGNTRLIAEAVADGLGEDFAVDISEVGEAVTDTAGYDLVVVGGPTHAFGMSRESTRDDAEERAAKTGGDVLSKRIGVREWLDALTPVGDAVAAAAFDTSGKIGWFRAGSAAKGEASRLTAKGFRLVEPPEQFDVAGIEGPLKGGEVDRARAWGQAIAGEMTGGG